MMRTFVFAGAGALMVASGVAYSLQVSRSTALEPAPSAPVNGASSPQALAPTTDEIAPVRKVRTVSILQDDAQGPNLTANTSEQPGKSPVTDGSAPTTEVADRHSVPMPTSVETTPEQAPAIRIAAAAEQEAGPSSGDQPFATPSSTKSVKRTAKKAHSRERVASDSPRAKSAGKQKHQDHPAEAIEEHAAPPPVQAASGAEFPNPISKLRRLFGAE